MQEPHLPPAILLCIERGSDLLALQEVLRGKGYRVYATTSRSDAIEEAFRGQAYTALITMFNEECITMAFRLMSKIPNLLLLGKDSYQICHGPQGEGLVMIRPMPSTPEGLVPLVEEVTGITMQQNWLESRSTSKPTTSTIRLDSRR